MKTGTGWDPIFRESKFSLTFREHKIHMWLEEESTGTLSTSIPHMHINGLAKVGAIVGWSGAMQSISIR